jgi:ABC-2 type transport system ATP-binding protein
VVTQAREVRSLIGLAGQYAAVDPNLTGRENLRMFARLHRMDRRAARTRADELLERFALTEAGDRVVKTYSGGMRRRLDLASALLGTPEVLFLDEPTTGLDPRSRLGLWETIEDRVAGGSTVLLTTQYLDEADRLADSIAVIDNGTVIAEGTADELKDRVGGERIELKLEDGGQCRAAISVLAPMSDERPTTEDGVVRVVPRERRGALAEAVRRLDEHGVVIDDIALRRPTLDDVFLTLTGHTAEQVAEDGAERDEVAA